jgi:hypothetical protein
MMGQTSPSAGQTSTPASPEKKETKQQIDESDTAAHAGKPDRQSKVLF